MFELIAIVYTVMRKYIQISLHLLVTDCCESSFLSSKKGLRSIPSSNLKKTIDETKCKIT